MGAILKVEELKKTAGSQEILKGVNLEVYKGERIVILGKSGAGKSTFLQCLTGLVQPDSGRVIFEGKDISKARGQIYLIRQRIQLVTQQPRLFENFSVVENLTLGLRMIAMDETAARYHALYLLDAVGLQDKADRYPAELSGGERQRIALIRAIAMRPKVMLLDEPTSALDRKTTGRVEELIKSLEHKEITMIIVTHNVDFARSVSTRVLEITEGKLVSRD